MNDRYELTDTCKTCGHRWKPSVKKYSSKRTCPKCKSVDVFRRESVIASIPTDPREYSLRSFFEAGIRSDGRWNDAPVRMLVNSDRSSALAITRKNGTIFNTIHDEACIAMERLEVAFRDAGGNDPIFQSAMLAWMGKVLRINTTTLLDMAVMDIVSILPKVEPETDGPFQKTWIHEGLEINDKMPPTASALVHHLWNARQLTSDIQDLAGSVFGDPRRDIEIGDVQNHSKNANAFFKRHDIPWIVRTLSEPSAHVMLVRIGR